MSNTQEKYVDKANATAIINKIETKLNNRYTKDEVDTLVESASGGDANLEKATYETSPATKAHSVGDYIYYNDVIYKVTSAIAINDTIAVGTNITADTGLDADTQMYIDGLPGTVDAPLGDHITVNGNPLSFVTDSAQVSNKTIVSLESIQAGSGDPSLSNVRAISGYDDIFIKASGKNLVDNNTIKQGRYRNDSATDRCASIDVMGVNPGDTVTISGQTSTIKVAIITYLNRGQESGPEDTSSGWITAFPYTYTFTSYGYVWLIYAKVDGTNITPSNVQTAQFQLELGSTATTYEPYNPATDITIPAPDGTIYGGTLDVESGELVVDRGFFTTTWGSTAGADLGTCTRKSFTGVPNTFTEAEGHHSICNVAKELIDWTSDTTHFYVANGGAYVFLPKNTSSDTVINIVYPLATPKTYYLSPHQVKLLTGHNIVTTNGTSLSLKYRKGDIAGLDDLSGLAESVEGIGKRLGIASTGEAIVVTTYTTSWRIPCDGYVYVHNDSGVKGILYIQNSNKDSFASIGKAEGNYTCFVREGMYLSTYDNPTVARFIPLL